MAAEKKVPDDADLIDPRSPLTMRRGPSLMIQGPGTHGEDLTVRTRIVSAQPVELPKAWVTILPESCKGCEMCVHACPSGNLEMSEGFNRNGYHPAVFNYQGRNGPCTACGLCHVVCPDFAISKVWRMKKQ